ncbi:MAG: hypothetical protein H6Q10_2290 [Acidobacteria bacterium]|nr:hypothetical protein [Acidobacteriota bacterium]
MTLITTPVKVRMFGEILSLTHVQIMARSGKLKMKPISPVKVIGSV